MASNNDPPERSAGQYPLTITPCRLAWALGARRRGSVRRQRLEEHRGSKRSAADASDFEKVKTLAPTIAEGVDVASDALTSGKKNVGRLKKGEQRCNDLLRRLETFRQDLPVDERPSIEATIKRVHSVQERFLSLVLDRGK